MDLQEASIRIAAELFHHFRLDNGAEIVGALRLLQDAPRLLSVFERALAVGKTNAGANVTLPDEAVALLRWSPDLACRSGWCKSDGTRPAVFDYLNGRFGMHAPSWDMFAKLASPDLRIGDIADLVLEVEEQPIS